jgi:hypothetical protein
MRQEIKLLKNNDNKKVEDLEWIDEFYRFLQGNVPDGIRLQRGHKPKLSEKKAFAIIWYLQEHLPILPDTIERCDKCGELYDSYSSGYHSEKKGKFFCDGCSVNED